MSVYCALERTESSREVDTGNVVIRYAVNTDDPDNPFLNVYHFYVYTATRSQGVGSDAMGDLIRFAQEQEVTHLNIAIQDPDGHTRDFLEKFAFDDIRGPYKRDAYENPLYDGVKYF